MSALSLLLVACFANNATVVPGNPNIPDGIVLPKEDPVQVPIIAKERVNITAPYTTHIPVSLQVRSCRTIVSSSINFGDNKFPEDLFNFLIEAGFEDEWSNPFGYLSDPNNTIPVTEQIWCVVCFSRKRGSLSTCLYMPHGTFKERQLLIFGNLQVLYCPKQQIIKSVTLQNALQKKISLHSHASSSSSQKYTSTEIKGWVNTTTGPVDCCLSVRPKGDNSKQCQSAISHAVTFTHDSNQRLCFQYRINCLPGSDAVALTDNCVKAVMSPKPFILTGSRTVDMYETEKTTVTVLELFEISIELQPMK